MPCPGARLAGAAGIQPATGCTPGAPVRDVGVACTGGPNGVLGRLGPATPGFTPPVWRTPWLRTAGLLVPIGAVAIGVVFGALAAAVAWVPVRAGWTPVWV